MGTPDQRGTDQRKFATSYWLPMERDGFGCLHVESVKMKKPACTTRAHGRHFTSCLGRVAKPAQQFLIGTDPQVVIDQRKNQENGRHLSDPEHA
jgi:hypothetical protein